MTGSRLFAETMRGYGVDHIFFVPFVLSRALAAMEDMNIRRVSAHSELATVYMADGYARAARKPGVCLAQAVGAANAAAGLREPFLSSTPVICVTGGPHADSRYRYLYQQIEDFPMFAPVTKFNARVDKVERLADLTRQAFREATSGTPGPVHLEIPGREGHLIDAEADFTPVFEERFSRYPAYRPEPEMAAVREAARVLAAAQRPVILAGGGVVASGAAPELVQLAEKLSIPVATSLNGKEAILDSHPLALGITGRYGRWCANRALAEADLVFWVGSRAGGHVTDDWKAPPEGTPAIQLDVNPAEIGRNYPAQVALVGDAKVTLQRLLEVAKPAGNREAWLGRTRSLVASWREKVAPLAASTAAPLRPERICKEVSDFLPADAVVVADTGHAAQWTGQLLNLTKPGQRYIRCAGTLGWGFPGAIGVKCALPDRPVLCFTGDGGFYYHVSELETAARLGINLVVLVNNNASLSQTRRGFTAAYGGALRGHGPELWKYKETDFARVAEAMGCVGIRVAHPSELRPALERAFAANRPVVLDVASDLEALPPEAWQK